MLDRLALGSIPPKHHIVHRDAGGQLLVEECITRMGFDGPYTIAYHTGRPQSGRSVSTRHGWERAELAFPEQLRRRHYTTPTLPTSGGCALDARKTLLVNDDVALGIVRPDREDPVYFVNSDADDLIYVFRGTGTVRTIFGDLHYKANDYICIPRGTVHRFLPDPGDQYWLTMECFGGVGLLKQWRNESGQLRMDAPYCHRDFTRPEFRGPLEEGIREVVVKRGGSFHGFAYADSPLDVVGWDGSVYPWIFPMLNFQPRVGLVHLPPTWHGTFAARGALICSFVPRPTDFHAQAIPCPYPHSSVDVDEVLFYCDGNFTSRRGVGPGSLSFHPAGVPHGPHPGAYEASIGTTHTTEQAVMLDTIKPLVPTTLAVGIEDAEYHESFVG